MSNSNDINQGFQQGLDTIQNTSTATHNGGTVTIHLLLILILTVVIVVIIKRLLIYRNCDLVESVKFGQSLKQPLDSQYVAGNATKMMANATVKQATIAFDSNDLIAKVPVKPSWMIFENNEVTKLIKEKVNSSETAEYLQSRFPNYTFGQFERHGKYFELRGYLKS